MIYLALNRAKIKGAIGERQLSSLLLFPTKHLYHTYNDLYIKTSSDTSQIDHVIVSQFGIFIVETKNYKGNIYGSSNSDNWTQNIGENKYPIPNPIQQNKAHIFTIKSILPAYAQSCFIPIIEFSSKASLYITTDDETEIIHFQEILSTIKS